MIPILRLADMFLRIKNALERKKEGVDIPSSKVKVAIARILSEEGFIESHDAFMKDRKKFLHMRLKYAVDPYGKAEKSVITDLIRVSKPGRRAYVSARKIPKVLGGFGVAIISTSAGIMTGRKAREKKIGGEVIGYAW